MTEKALNNLLNDSEIMTNYYTELMQNFAFCSTVNSEEEESK